MDDLFFGMLLAVIIMLFGWLIFEIGGEAELRDVVSMCTDYGKVQIRQNWYECKPIGN